MAVIVQKFGGTSVANIERIQHVASLVKAERKKGNGVVVVLSAMSGATNQLVAWANEAAGSEEALSWEEYDTVVATGEQVTVGLLAITLLAQGIPAKSLLGWQLPITSDNLHGRARIIEIETKQIKALLKKGIVPIIPGFQGVTEEGRVTTLGRGGSDTSAVAVAAALKADRCDIYTDVDGVYTSDPRIVSKARKLNKINYEEMLEMASLGAKVLHLRSVEMAMKYHVRLQVLSSFTDKPGTVLVEEEEVMERRLITGVTYSRNEARITISGVENKPGIAADIFGPLAEAEINVDMIVQNITEDGKRTDITFTVDRSSLAAATKAIKELKKHLKFDSILTDNKVAKVSVVGVGMRSHAGLAQKMFKTLADKNINIQVISTSEIKVSVLIDEAYVELALRSLHTAYGLDAKE